MGSRGNTLRKTTFKQQDYPLNPPHRWATACNSSETSYYGGCRLDTAPSGAPRGTPWHSIPLNNLGFRLKSVGLLRYFLLFCDTFLCIICILYLYHLLVLLVHWIWEAQIYKLIVNIMRTQQQVGSIRGRSGGRLGKSRTGQHCTSTVHRFNPQLFHAFSI